MYLLGFATQSRDNMNTNAVSEQPYGFLERQTSIPGKLRIVIMTKAKAQIEMQLARDISGTKKHLLVCY